MTNFYWLNEDSRRFLARDYLKPGVSPEARIRQIAERAEQILAKPGFADKFEEYMSRGFFSLATPIWTNFGENRGLPISCYGSYISDTMSSILYKAAEVGMMSKVGGGTSAYLGDLRPRGSTISIGGTSSGPVHFLEIYNSVCNVVSQSSTRRGNFAAYLPVEHPDILEFLTIRSTGHTIQDISIGVTITDKWMEEMIAGDVRKREVWAAIIKKRFESGYPYLQFIDTCNRNKPLAYKEQNYVITHSNLCDEISLPDSETESFVCCLSSLNALRWNELKETDAIETLTMFLDAVMSEFIEKARDIPFLEHAVNFAENHRAIGIGVLGWHSFLQSQMIPFESMAAKYLNQEVFQTLDQRSLAASRQMAKEYGEPPVLVGYGERNATRIAIAPTTSSSFILGQVSPSIEPLNSNYFVKKLSKGTFSFKNPFLEELLEKKGYNTEQTWKTILQNGGSVQSLDCLTDHEKEVFKTFGEISQKEVVIQAAQRQKYIDQSQSLNVMIGPDVPAKEVSDLLIEGWRLGVKGFYYQRGANSAQQLSRSIMTCKACEA